MLYLMKDILFFHNNEIIHRDIKPENILFSIKGKYLSLKLIYFGLSTNFNSKREKYYFFNMFLIILIMYINILLF